ncbi:ORF6N domain-containing protein [Rugamonas aquatica]|uniref:ORF6N domain-containing protein n=1 Tax=Rugamonas aquatica TaxID=2743357 RepID=A0A6A7N580_9BURK|nr:ORF6N domain-containing protein [Rugamonas aquatica]MQA40223.1 ORF6N domain-containing protein [Rugamonas aquatica]
MNAKLTTPFCATNIASHIRVFREQKIMLDTDLANMYGVTTGSLVQSVKRNLDRFPVDFMFQLDTSEWEGLRSQIVISNPTRGGRRYAPYAFTEQGVAMLSSVLNSPQAIAVNIEIMRTFVRLRETATTNKEVLLRINDLESKTALLSSKHDELTQDTYLHIKQIFEVIRDLRASPPQKPKRPIGFVTPDEK